MTSAAVEAQWEAIYADPQAQHKNQYPTELVVSTVFRNFRDRTGRAALDMGCGWGNNLRFLRDAGFDAHGIEISQTAVDALQDEFGDRVMQGSFVELPYADGTFDFVLDRSSIQHNPRADIPQAIREAHRVLKPGGIFFSMLVASQTNEYGATVVTADEIDELFSMFDDVTLDNETRTRNGGARVHSVHLVQARK